ncbi:RNA polymerase sigma factor [Polaribacter gangjinensis]|uniref:RNA polymerase subunit sigma-70 n=1 Tax=Polaribacter gangjinensis TaxID=574710 RepID=A0A2S7W9U2_9FLAO|nr:sigma-70 family RNA polymerase sigma factor [Polaribacter gangjinensis]PQJ74186.1 RNA polymerase subunit sigma-70 [Polaribacter gangjinensis]
MKPTKQLHQHIIDQCKQNNAKAQMQLYGLYCKAMFSVALRMVNDTFVAEEVMQKAFIKAFKKIDTYKNEVAFGAWLKRIVINQSMDELKKKNTDIIPISKEIMTISEEEENWQIEHEITMEDVKKAMQQLKDKYRIILTLYLIEGYDHQEIAEILNITENTSRTQLLRGKNALKEALKCRL